MVQFVAHNILRLPIIPIIRLPIIPIRLLIITYIRLPIIPITYNTYKITYNNDHQLFRTPDPKLNVVGIVGQNQHSVANSHYRRVNSAFLRTTDDLSKVTMTSGSGSQSILGVSEMPTPCELAGPRFVRKKWVGSRFELLGEIITVNISGNYICEHFWKL